jgi:hypothetical protein
MRGLDDYLIDPNVSLLSKTPNRQPLGADKIVKPADIARSPIAGCGLAMSLRMRRRPRGDGVFCGGADGGLSLRRSQIGQSIPIVAETEQVADRRNSCLKSIAQISDGSRRRFFVAGAKLRNVGMALENITKIRRLPI